MKVSPIKKCSWCNNFFSKRCTTSKRAWEKQKLCSLYCKYNASIGVIPWNKKEKVSSTHIPKQERSNAWNGGRGHSYGRKVALSHYPKECMTCGYTQEVTVHHIDKNPNNNNPENLQVLCYKCHMSLHKKGKRLSIKTEFKKGQTPWNKNNVDVKEIMKWRKLGMGYRTIASKVGASKDVVRARIKSFDNV